MKSALVLMLCISLLAGCTSYMTGYTQQQASERYLKVDEVRQNFGYKRLNYVMGHYTPLKGFIEDHGKPDFTYEFKNKKGKDSIRLYYYKDDVVYTFSVRNWDPGSLYFVEQRPLTAFEKSMYAELTKEQ